MDEAGALADDIRAHPGCESWVIDYFSPRLLRAYQKHQPHPKVPVRLDPPSWEAFFTERGWRIKDIRFLGEESERLHRPVPLSLLDKVMRLLHLDRFGTWATRASSPFPEGSSARLHETATRAMGAIHSRRNDVPFAEALRAFLRSAGMVVQVSFR